MDNGRFGESLRSKDYNSRLQLHRFIWFPSAGGLVAVTLLTLCKELSQENKWWPYSSTHEFDTKNLFSISMGLYATLIVLCRKNQILFGHNITMWMCEAWENRTENNLEICKAFEKHRTLSTYWKKLKNHSMRPSQD